jgi:RAP1 GTPase activating protein 1
MYHVAPMIPFTPEDPQQLERKRHIGNDLCVLIFLDEGADFPNLDSFKTEMTNVYMVVSLLENHPVHGRFYRIGVVSKSGVDCVTPDIPHSVAGGDGLRRFILAKLINCERAVLRSPAFVQRRRTARKTLLLNLYNDNRHVIARCVAFSRLLMQRSVSTTILHA